MTLIDQKLANDQAVLVVFKDKNSLEKFETLIKEKNLDYETLKINTKLPDNVISKATRAKSLTLMQREFGRGRDFYCTDQKVKEKGGVVVI